MITAIYQATPQQARTLTDRIKVSVEGVWHLIEEAYTTRAYLALGYANWDDYCTREFGTSRLRLPREDRSEVVASLRDSGLSIRAIESATGVSRPTVIKDLRDREVVNSLPPAAPDPEVTEALDEIDDDDALTEEECEALDAQRAAQIEADMDQSSDDDVITPQPDPVPAPRITGTDGKTYPKPTPKPPRAPNRKALTDQFFDATSDLVKVCERIQRLAADDRFPQNKEQLAARHRNELLNLIDALTGVTNQLT